ncbi:hypothetical protein C1A38_02455 [Verrucosispora sp. ts21]|uniref:hypothetical protein n=1 Tax=Micromonospora TaxID=1873 RepID=UPI000C880508|nr:MULTISPECIES: hypothetical protein [Micromonospora]PMR62634.1 hypothetical protein C1A38_02455 [Verrucosispora sp. ts21]WSK45201.1 hypothetical protein OG712_14410 [Micromonospora maris]
MSSTTNRHAVGAAVAWMVFVAQAPFVYAGLIVYAWNTTGDLGGPFALPAMCCSLTCVGAALVPLLFVPAGWVGEITAKSGHLHMKLLVAFAVAAVLAMIYVAGITVLTGGPTAVGTLLLCLCGTGAVLGPTAAYVGVIHRRPRMSPSHLDR